MRCRSTGLASATTSSIEGDSRPSSSARARAASISAWLARGPGPQETWRRTISIPLVSGRPQLFGRHGLLCLLFAGAGGRDQHAPLGLEIGVIDLDLDQEPVELRLGQ